MTLAQLRAVVAVATYGNFGEAGLHLELSQSAISHAIANLEAELGVVLFTRGRHGAYPTPVGDRVIDHAHRVLKPLSALVKDVNLEKRLQSGQVRIACFRTVATHLLPAVINRFRDRFPNIAVTLNEHWDYIGVEQDLRDGRVDLGFTQLPTTDEFETWELLRDEYIVLLPPKTLNTVDQLTWEQLATYPLIFPSNGGNCYTLIHKHLTRCQFPIKIAYDVKESSTMVSMAVQGLGAAILARLSAEPIPPEVQVLSLPVPLERSIGVAMLANALQTPAVFAFLDLLKTAKFDRQ
ncbi:MAG: LysR family transcriptional regulator [Stenomitos rutilans HA7619-LM2]|nr:LysR family transcriptional regulator [Stenomitos rutilans HA7619-LM2]